MEERRRDRELDVLKYQIGLSRSRFTDYNVKPRRKQEFPCDGTKSVKPELLKHVRTLQDS